VLLGCPLLDCTGCHCSPRSPVTPPDQCWHELTCQGSCVPGPPALDAEGQAGRVFAWCFLVPLAWLTSVHAPRAAKDTRRADAARDRPGGAQNYTSVLEVILRLRQICCSAQLVPKEPPSGAGAGAPSDPAVAAAQLARLQELLAEGGLGECAGGSCLRARHPPPPSAPAIHPTWPLTCTLTCHAVMSHLSPLWHRHDGSVTFDLRYTDAPHALQLKCITAAGLSSGCLPRLRSVPERADGRAVHHALPARLLPRVHRGRDRAQQARVPALPRRAEQGGAAGPAATRRREGRGRAGLLRRAVDKQGFVSLQPVCAVL